MKTSQRKAARAKRERRYQGHGARDDLIAHNPVAQAMARQRIEADIRALRTRAGLQAHLGEDAPVLADACGRLIFVVAHAAGLHGLHDTPEARILLGTANALGDVAATPAMLEQQRAAITSGLAAIERLLPQLPESALAAGALELQYVLQRGDVGTVSVERALRPELAASADVEACEA